MSACGPCRSRTIFCTDECGEPCCKKVIIIASLIGPQGYPALLPGGPGAQGSPGEDGRRGAQGNPGENGQMGPQGAFGEGQVGAQGIIGGVGAQGNPGDSGGDGVPGNQGIMGKIGQQGAQGNPGKSAWGQQGAQGNPGVDGLNGAQGAQGNPGQNGPRGAQGNPGQVGQVGAQGNPGQVGVIGSQGAQGAQGNPGTQGAPGLNNIKLSSNFVNLFSTDMGSDTAGFLTTWNSSPFTISNYSTSIRTMVLYINFVLELTPKVGPVTFAPEVIVSVRSSVSGLFDRDIYAPTTLQLNPAPIPYPGQSPVWLCTGNQLLYSASLPSILTPITFSVYVRLNQVTPTNFTITISDQSYQSIYLTAIYE